MKTFLWILYQPYKWIFLFPFMALNSLVFGILAVTLSLFINQKVGSYVGGVIWAKLNTIFTPVRIKVKGKSNVARGQSYVIIANHLSTFDIFALYGWLGIDFKWVMKKEIKKYPGVGFGSQAVGHIFIDRSSSAEAIKSINAAKEKIKNGTSVIFFPEGTRSKTSQLLPFKKGAFRFAFDLDLPILPVTINGTEKVFPTGTWNLFPGKVNVIIHAPIDIHKYGESNMQPLIADAKEIITSARAPVI
ncbi:MAG: 1-acyl-sn-glycerol-3-phosphate acyltransferase [Cytophagales bacterium]|nr:1-acyl-sn-glycerol-3-phosphate acyltransferase [Cytophagales bacterium]